MKKMKKLIMVCVMLCLSAVAAEAAEMKIGIVDATGAIAESNMFKHEQQRIAGIEKKINRRLQKIQKKVVQLKQQFQKNNRQWTADQTLAKQKDIADLEIRFNRDKSDGIQVLKRENAQLQQAGITLLKKAIQTIGKRKEYALILQKNPAILYDDGTADITGDVVREMNRAK